MNTNVLKPFFYSNIPSVALSDIDENYPMLIGKSEKEKLEFLNNSPYFIGFDLKQKPIIDNTKEKKIVEYVSNPTVSFMYSFPIYEDYFVISFDKYNQPLYAHIDSFAQEMKEKFVHNHQFYYGSKKDAEEEYDFLVEQENEELKERLKQTHLEKWQQTFVIGITRNNEFFPQTFNSILNYIISPFNDTLTGYKGYTWSKLYRSRYDYHKRVQFIDTQPITHTMNNGYSTGYAFNPPKTQQEIEMEKQERLRKMEEKLKEQMKNNPITRSNLLLSDVSVFKEEWNTPEVQDNLLCSEQNWKGVAYSYTGVAHIKNGTVCQDSSILFNSDKSNLNILIVSDGAGSAKHSEMGSKTLTYGLKRFIISTYDLLLRPLLEQEQSVDVQQEQMQKAKMAIVKHAIGLIMDLAEIENKPINDFFATLNIAIVGKNKTLWLRVGDGGFVVQRAYMSKTIEEDNTTKQEIKYVWESLNDVSKSKGEFKNQTHFIEPQLSPEYIQMGLFDNENVTAIALMSDGVSERVISSDDCAVSNVLSDFSTIIRQNNKLDFYEFLISDEFVKNKHTNTETGETKMVKEHNGDDCSLVMISRLTDYEQEIIDEENRKIELERQLKAQRELEEKRKKEEERQRAFQGSYFSNSTKWKTTNKIYDKQQNIFAHHYDNSDDSKIIEDWLNYNNTDKHDFNRK